MPDYLTGSDASDPDFALPGDVACGYVGGDTPHVWTEAQWRKQTAKYLLPIYVPFRGGNPKLQGVQCADTLRAAGVPEHVLYAVDAELLWQGDASGINAFCDVTAERHNGALIYAQLSLIFSLPPRSGYWVANPTGVPHMYEHPFVKGTQWDFETRIDRDLFLPGLQLWENPYV